MRGSYITLLLCFLLAGCANIVKTPLHGNAAFSQCSDGKCLLDISFPVDSVLAIEGAEKAKTIYFAGKVYLIGNGFSNLWIGEIEDESIEFTRKELIDAPAMVTTFDWEKGKLTVNWRSNEDIRHKLFIDNRGKISEEQ